MLVWLALLVTLQAIIADHHSLAGTKSEQISWLFRQPWVDQRAAMTALVGMFGIAIARHNIALGFRPYLSYSNLFPKIEDKPPRYIVVLSNEGTGPALIVSVKYRIKYSGEREYEAILDHEAVVQRLESRNKLKEGNDYDLPRFSSGASLGKDKDRTILAINKEAIATFFTPLYFDMVVRYRGILGDLYEKTVHCIPRPEYRRPRSLQADSNSSPEVSP